MLLHHIHEYVQGRIDDPNYWTDARLTVLANDGVRDLVSRFEILRVQAYATFNTVASQQRYPLPVNYIDTHLMYYNSGRNQEITFTSGPKQIYGQVGDVTLEAAPTHAYKWAVEDQPELWFYPVPDAAYSIEHFYFASSAELEEDDDEPQIPRDLHQYLVDYVELRTKVQDQLISESEFTGLWEIKINNIQSSEVLKALSGNEIKPGSGTWMFPYELETNRPRLRLSSSTYRW